jgi:hypothetical protein
MQIVFDIAATNTLRGLTPDDADFTLKSESDPTLVSSSGSSNSTVDDREITTYTGATYNNGYRVTVVENTPDTIDESAEFTSGNEAVATVSSAGVVSRVSNGTTNIYYRTIRLTKALSLTVSQSVGSSVAVQTGYSTGTLAKHCTDAVDDLIYGLTPATIKPMFSTFDHTTPSYARSDDCWISGFDLTCIAVWNSYAGSGKFGPTAITPRHVAYANHVLIPDGTTLRFVTSTGSVETATLQTSERVGTSDLRIGKLSADLPGTITPCKAFPLNALNYLPSLNNHHELPCLLVNQSREALVADYRVGADGTINDEDKGYGDVPTNATRLAMYETLLSGDSGLPAFVFVNGDPVIIFTSSAGYDQTSGPNFIFLHDDINSVLTSLGGGYQLDDADLSGFTDFS